MLSICVSGVACLLLEWGRVFAIFCLQFAYFAMDYYIPILIGGGFGVFKGYGVFVCIIERILD